MSALSYAAINADLFGVLAALSGSPFAVQVEQEPGECYDEGRDIEPADLPLAGTDLNNCDAT